MEIKKKPAPPPAQKREGKEKLVTKILRFRLSQKGPWWNRQVPTLLGLSLIVGGVILSVSLTLKVKKGQIEAQQSLAPADIRITNLSDASFTISWVSEQPTTGFVSFGETPSLGQTGLDDRDKERSKTEVFVTHHVTLPGLQPETTYYFKIGSGQKLYGQNGKEFQVQTASEIQTLPVSDTAYGQVLQSEGTAAEGAVVYLTISGCTPLSTLVKASGNWLISKNLSLKEDKSSFCQYPKRGGELNILVQGGEIGTSKAVLLTGLDQPVPNITLGKDYSFKDLSLLKPLGTPQPTPTVTPTETPIESPLPIRLGDLNHDGVVNTWDVGILKTNFGEGPQNEEADLNKDGAVDQKDLEILLDNFNQ